ncbi:MAG TPA: NFACT family protein [Thermoplasmata archaeon]|nr:NFACT family protein [Thermoplasmata archaeon]
MSDAATGPAKDRFTSLDTLAVVREIRAAGPLFVDKLFDVAPETWEMTLRAAGKGKWALLLASGKYATLRRETGPHAEELGHLTKELRRHLAGIALTGVAEPRGERLLELEAHRGDSGNLRLIVEFFGKGNLLLVREDKILAVAHSQTWAHRTIRAGAVYVPPPLHANPWTMGVAELEAALSRSSTDRVRTLAAQLGFGGPVAEELLHRAVTKETEPATLEVSQVAARIHDAVAELVSEVGDAPRGYLYRRGDVLVDVEPFASRRWNAEPGIREERFDRFSDATFVYFSSVAPPVLPPPVDPLAEFRRQAARQVTAISKLSEEVERLRAQANAIFTHYEAAERALESKGPGNSDDPMEVDLGGVLVPLRPDRPPRESAQEIFTELKRIQSKIAGAETALKATEARLQSGSPLPGEPVGRSSGGPARRGKVRWFEKFHWFLTSEGVLVIGGRDAATNDLIVRRYLGVNDLYVHADVHGAASVIVKRPPEGSPGPGPSSLAEAGQWAVSYSKAWRAGHASADAFWVTPEQVSKTPASGEFVARGAWVIHGTKNWLKDCRLELGLGQVDYEGESLWTAAPPEALRARGRLRLVLTPGEDRERSEREVEIVRELGLSRDLLQRLLPAGGLSIRRV